MYLDAPGIVKRATIPVSITPKQSDMRMNYNAQNERKKNYWLGISGTILFLATIIGCILEIMK